MIFNNKNESADNWIEDIKILSCKWIKVKVIEFNYSSKKYYYYKDYEDRKYWMIGEEAL